MAKFNVVFDMDGVIFDTEQFWIDCLRPAAEEMQLKNIEEVCYRCIGITETETMKIVVEAYGSEEVVAAPER